MASLASRISLFAAVVCGALASALPPANAQPAFTASISGPPQAVFDTRTQSCDKLDIPDSVPHAFRDDRGMVHLVGSHYAARALIGPTLDSVKRDCRVIYRSPEDPDPSHFQDRDWLTSIFSIDGRRVMALVHGEYDLRYFRQCPYPGFPEQKKCYRTSITYALSTDGGYTFTEPPPPQNLVATAPYPYNRARPEGPMGYRTPTNILQVGNLYYAMINAFHFGPQEFGACLMRTANLLDPKSWRAWDGNDFTIRFIDPYVERNVPPAQHVCKPVIAGVVHSLSIDQRTGHTIALLEAQGNSYGGEPGAYAVVSADLTHWSRPAPLASESVLIAGEGPGRWGVGYYSIIDPASTDRNFSTVTEHPYLYYVRYDKIHQSRTLMRRQITLHISG